MFLYCGDYFLGARFCWFSEIVFFSKVSLVFGIFKTGFEFDMTLKIFQFFVKQGFIEIYLVGTKFKSLSNSLEVSFVNLFLLKLISCPAGSN